MRLTLTGIGAVLQERDQYTTIRELTPGGPAALSGELKDLQIAVILQELEELLSIGPIRLYLHDRHASEPVEVVTTASQQRPYYCRDHSCTACLVAPEAYEELPSDGNDGQRAQSEKEDGCGKRGKTGIQ